MNKFYRIKFDKVDYNQYDSFIVCAATMDEALSILRKEHPLEEEYPEVNWHGYTIEEVEAEKGIILGSYNAG